MDLRLFVGVMGRYRRQVIGGVALAVVLALLAYGTPTISNGGPTLRPHSPAVWQSEAELLITQSSFPYGHAAPQYLEGSGKTPPVLVGEESYMSSLAPIYVALANGDAVQSLLVKPGSITRQVKAGEVFNPGTGAPMPLMTLTTLAPTSGAAITLAHKAIKVVENFVSVEQTDAGISSSQRVELQVVKDGVPAKLVSGHKLTLPVLVFVIVLALAIAVAFVRENMDPRTAAALGRVPRVDGDGAREPSKNGHREKDERAAVMGDMSRPGGAVKRTSRAPRRRT